jgi:hypothetical protein
VRPGSAYGRSVTPAGAFLYHDRDDATLQLLDVAERG